jgi:drug/metabolite transporter (DMT)-like permease
MTTPETNQPSPLFVGLTLMGGVVCISTAAVFIKLCDDAPASVIAAARMSFAALVLIPIAFAQNGKSLVSVPRECRWHTLWAGVFLGAHFFFWIASLKHTSVLSSVVIVTTNPIFVGLASPFFLGEKIGRRLIYGIIFAAAGGLLIALSDAGGKPGSMYGNFLSFLGVLMASSYWMVGRHVRARVDLLSYTLPVYAVAAVVLIIAAIAMGGPFTGFRPRTYLCFALLAVVPQLLGHTAMNYALRHVSATLVAVCILGEPIGASILAMTLLKEIPTFLQIAGGSLILIGIVTASSQKRGS